MRNLFFVALVIILIAGCKKDGEIEAPHGTVNLYNYFPLSIGNYWVYQNYNIDSLGNETLTDRIDSMYINRDTIVNGYQYYVLEGTNFTMGGYAPGIIRLLRDSSGYIVDEGGRRRIAQNNYTDTLYNESRPINGNHYYDISSIMKTVDNDISVAAGLFDVIECEIMITIVTPIPTQGETRYHHNYYADNIGEVVGAGSWYSSKGHFETRLLRYNIE